MVDGRGLALAIKIPIADQQAVGDRIGSKGGLAREMAWMPEGIIAQVLIDPPPVVAILVAGSTVPTLKALPCSRSEPRDDTGANQFSSSADLQNSDLSEQAAAKGQRGLNWDNSANLQKNPHR